MNPTEIIEKVKSLPNWLAQGEGAVNLVTGAIIYRGEKDHFLKGITKGEKILRVDYGSYTGTQTAPRRIALGTEEEVQKFLQTAIAETKLLFPDWKG